MEVVTILGIVVDGKRVGRTLGFPTANVQPFPGQDVPRTGVYIGEIRIEGEDAARRCLINHGYQPTIPSGKSMVEVYILDFDGDIYGRGVALRFLTFLRDERRFGSVEALKAQLARDVEMARGGPH